LGLEGFVGGFVLNERGGEVGADALGGLNAVAGGVV